MSVTKIDGTRQIAASSITNAVQNFGTPSASTDVAIKSYVDSVAQGLSVKPSAAAATTAALSPTNTYSTGVLTATGVGTLTIDGYLTALGDYVLVNNEASGLKNGLYKVTTAGTAGVAYVLTRAVEMTTSSQFTGAFVFIEQGTVNASSGWVCTNIAPTVGTTAITFTQFSGAGEITAGNGLLKSGNSLSIDTSITVDKTTAQTLTNKTLTSPILTTPSLGVATATSINGITITAGTGTLTLGTKTLTVSNSITLAGTDSTTMTFPSTSATIARTDAGQTFTGVQTMTSPALTTPAITGLATGSGVASAATASTLMSRDSNANTTINNLIESYTTVTTAAGTTTLTVGSTYLQFFTGTTTQTVVLPVTSTLVTGQEFYIINNSTGAVTVQSSGANTVIILAGNTSAILTCILTTGTTAASWSYIYNGIVAASGKALTISNSLTLAGTDGSTLNIGTGGTLGTNAYSSTAYAPIASPTFTGTVTMPSPFTLGATSVTTTGTQLNYLNAATGTTGTTSTNVVFSTSPTLVTPTLGVASATSLATSAASPFLLTNGQLVTIALTSQTVGGTTLTIPNFASVSDTFVFTTLAQTLSNKTFVAPALGTPASGVMTNVTGTASSLTSGITQALASATTTVNVSSATAPTSGQVLTATSGTAATWQSVTSTTYTRSTAVTGTQDGTNKTFTIANAVSSGSEQVYVNGQLLTPGSSNDYVISSTTVTFQSAFTAPASTDVIRVYGVY